jgi:hypothetical protein
LLVSGSVSLAASLFVSQPGHFKPALLGLPLHFGLGFPAGFILPSGFGFKRGLGVRLGLPTSLLALPLMKQFHRHGLEFGPVPGMNGGPGIEFKCAFTVAHVPK